MAPVDIAVATILGIALLRGLFRGLIREVFSIAALAGACIAVQVFAGRLADWLARATGAELSGLTALWLAGTLLAVGSIAAVVLAGRMLRRGARWSGLGWADRAGGALLGAAEGALVVAILLAGAAWMLGRSHPAIAATRSLAALERLERLAQGDERGGEIDVAAPPRS
jgi:membrane protein required for colicin V production